MPTSTLRGDGELLPPPSAIAPQDLTPEALSDAWENGETNAAAIVRVLSHKQGVAVPWGLVRDGLREAVRSRWLETARGNSDSGRASTAAQG